MVLALALVLPAAIALAKGGTPPTITLWRIIGAAIVVAIYLTGGGVAAFLIGDASRAKDAFAYGMAWEAILGGVVLTGKALLPKPPGT
jgi:hypothetical protein